MKTRDEFQPQFDRFQRDIAEHAVTVLRDDGLYRHLRCRRGDSYNMGFDVIAWPGYLCYAGDMGCFVFSRLPDMLEFFRGRDGAVIDRGYLAQKACAVDKPDGLTRFSDDLFTEAVKSRFDEFTDDWSEGEKAALWERIEDEVLPHGNESHEAALAAASDFMHPEFGRERQQVFPDFWEHNLKEYTARFWWCCYAIPWAIAKYDALSVEAREATSVGQHEPSATSCVLSDGENRSPLPDSRKQDA